MHHVVFKRITGLCLGYFFGIGFVVSASSSSSETSHRYHHDDHPISSPKKFCGSYRPYPYVGFRCQYPESPLLGLMWYHQPTNNNLSPSLYSRLRHEANHDDQLEHFGWNQHDGEGYGLQNISDPHNHINLTIHWIAMDTHNNLLQQQQQQHQQHHQQHWVLRVKGVNYYQDHEDTLDDPESLSLLWYVATPDNLTATIDPTTNIICGNDYSTSIQHNINNTHPSYTDSRTNTSHVYNATYFGVFQVPYTQHFNPKPTIVQELRNPTSTLPPHLFDNSSLYRAATPKKGNQIVQQVFLNTPFEIDFHFVLQMKLDGEPIQRKMTSVTADNRTCVMPTTSRWQEVTEALDDAHLHFQKRFHETFVDPRTNHNKTIRSLLGHNSTQKWTDDYFQTAQYALGNMLSSITYMHGTSQVFDNLSGQIITSQHRSTSFAIVSDRPDHAQGYLWDDGFHQQLVRFWDMEWTLKILTSWYDKTDIDGWIPRQMIIGHEVQWSARYV
jgi:mannosyl-oligosaccharide glucosidase